MFNIQLQLLRVARVKKRDCHSVVFLYDRKGEKTMKQKVISEVMQGMLGCLNNVQLERLQEVLEHALFHKQISETEEEVNVALTNKQLLENFLAAKRIE